MDQNTERKQRGIKQPCARRCNQSMPGCTNLSPPIWRPYSSSESDSKLSSSELLIFELDSLPSLLESDSSSSGFDSDLDTATGTLGTADLAAGSRSRTFGEDEYSCLIGKPPVTRASFGACCERGAETDATRTGRALLFEAVETAAWF